MSYEQGLNSSRFNPPGNPGSQAYKDYEQGWNAGGLLRTLKGIQEREAEEREREKAAPARTSKPGWFDVAIVLGLALYILFCFHFLKIVLCTLLVLGVIGWLLVKKKGKWVAYGLLVFSLLAGLSVFSRWVERKMAHQAAQARREQRKEEYARQVLELHRADSILSINRAKYSSLRLNRAKALSQSKATKPHHSSRPTLAEAMGME